MDVTSESKKILIIDDEEAIVELITEILERENYNPIGVTKWTDALAALESEKPSLLLIDLKMPTIDGASIIEFIRNEGLNLPVIVVSGFVTDEVKYNLTKQGVNGFIRKPFKAAHLKEEIERVLSESAAPAEIPEDNTTPQATSVGSLYDSPPNEPSPPVGSAATAGSLYGDTESTESNESVSPPSMNLLYSSDATPLSKEESTVTPTNDADVLSAFEKRSGTKPPSPPDEEVLQAFQKSDSKPDAPPASSPPAQAPPPRAHTPPPTPAPSSPSTPDTNLASPANRRFQLVLT